MSHHTGLSLGGKIIAYHYPTHRPSFRRRVKIIMILKVMMMMRGNTTLRSKILRIMLRVITGPNLKMRVSVKRLLP